MRTEKMSTNRSAITRALLFESTETAHRISEEWQHSSLLSIKRENLPQHTYAGTEQFQRNNSRAH